MPGTKKETVVKLEKLHHHQRTSPKYWEVMCAFNTGILSLFLIRTTYKIKNNQVVT